MSQPSWDLSRFIKTLSYFGAIPVLNNLDWLQQWLGSRANPQADSSKIAYGQASDATLPRGNADGVWVLGAAGDVGQQVVQHLQERGERVRSLNLSDLTDPQSAVALLAEVKALVICLSTPDTTPDTVIDAAPDAVIEPDSARAIAPSHLAVLLQAFQAMNSVGQPIFDFTRPASDLQEIWGALDDVVMGGVSQSGMQFEAGMAVFSGTVSTANSGGFASVRTRNFTPCLDLSAYDGIALRVKGDGNRYKFMVRDADRWDGVAYAGSFETKSDTWITVRLPFEQLVPVFRAKTVSSVLNPAQINALQLMLSKFEYDGDLNPQFTPGHFTLQVDAIWAYRQADLPLVMLISATPNEGFTATVQQSGLPYLMTQPGAVSDEDWDRLLRSVKLSG